jgi:hypothetical protein
VQRAGPFRTLSRRNCSTHQPITVSGNLAVDAITDLPQSRDEVEQRELAEETSRIDRTDNSFRSSKDPSSGVHQVHSLHADLMSQARKTFKTAWSVKINQLDIDLSHPCLQLRRSSRAESTVAVVEDDVSARWVCAECCSRHDEFLLPAN